MNYGFNEDTKRSACTKADGPMDLWCHCSKLLLRVRTTTAMKVQSVDKANQSAALRSFGRRCMIFLGMFLLLLQAVCATKAQTPLTTLNYKIVGTYLKVSPAAVSVPKGIAGSVMVEIANSDGSDKKPDNAITDGSYIEATLRGPSFPARRLVGQVNAPLLLPSLNLVGDYQLDNIRLVDAVTGAVRMEGTPSSVPVHVFDEILVSKVTSRPLTLEEIQQKGIVIDDQNFRAVEFEVGFVLDGRTIPVKFPVVTPDFTASKELIPAAELEKRLVAAQQINNDLARSDAFTLPPELEAAGLNLEIKGCNFEVAEVTERNLRLGIPPIPALMVIPGNVGYLNQFFSVQIYTENAAPLGSGLSVFDLDAHLILPPGADQIPSADYNAPGDDPLRFARVGPDKIIQSVQPIHRPGPDGVLGTADDIGRLYPKEAGQAEFLVEGLKEGLHVMDLELSGQLDGLAAGTVKIKGRASGSVLVRNPKFSLSFLHPRTVRTGEPYDAFVTILNTSQVDANFVSVTLPKGSISGGELMSPEKVELGTVKPGQTATAKFRVRAQRTGQVTFSNLTTSEDSIVGRFKLRMGVDERGVELSPDTIAYPAYVDNLPEDLFNAANRVIGQALSVATAPVLPAGVKKIPFSIIEKRVLEMAEAGQRLAYGDETNKVLLDLLLDFQGGRAWNEGFDQIVRSADAGRELREAFGKVIETNDTLNASQRLVSRATDIAGRGEAWQLASSSDSNIEISVTTENGSATLDESSINHGALYRGQRGHLAATAATNVMLHWEAKQFVASAELNALLISTNGAGKLIRWTFNSVPAGACYSYALNATDGQLRADFDCDGQVDQRLAGTITSISENAPQIVTVRQVPEIVSVRPFPSCVGAPAWNYATVVAVLFSKPMTQTNANIPSAYKLDNGVEAMFVQMQPGGRVALLNMRQGLGAVHPRSMSITGVKDARGNLMASNSVPVLNLIREGVAVKGRVLRGDGTPAAFIPVTLTMNDVSKDPFDRCDPPVITKLTQVMTDENGGFAFDFIVAGVPYTISATDTGGLPPEVIQEILQSWKGNQFDAERFAARMVQTNILASMGVTTADAAVALAEGLDRAIWNDRAQYEPGAMGTEKTIALRFRGRGVVMGKVVGSDGTTPVAHAAVNLFPDPDSRELGRGVFSDPNGSFQFNGVPLGQYSLQVKASTGQFRTLSGLLTQPGQTENVTVVLTAPTPDEVIRTSLRGIITEPDNSTPHAHATVFLRNSDGRVVGVAETGLDGYWEVNDIPVGTYYVGAFSADKRRKAERGGVQAASGGNSFVQLPLNGTGRVLGRVENSSGQPVPNALVAGGETLVRTDTNGLFTLTGVPLGTRTINAGLESQFAPNGFPRLGSSSLDVLPGIDNFVVVRLRAAGVITGRVTDADGHAIPYVNVSIPVKGGFAYVKANDKGLYKFINMAPGDYTVSAPAPPVQKSNEELLEQISSGDDDEIIAAMTEAFTTYSGVNNPQLGGTNTVFNPGEWGFTKTSIIADGDVAEANVRYLRQGTVSGIVLNHQGVPIGAKVRLTGIGPLEDGSPGLMIRGEKNSDAAEGTFSFPNKLMVGDWAVQVASPFYSVVLNQVGRTTEFEPNVTNLVMQFPPREDTHGRLAGRVFYPDGTPVGSGVKVTTHFGPGIENTTDTNGYFANLFDINQGGYTVEAFDVVTGFRAQVNASVVAGRSNYVEITLKGLGNLEFQARQGNGQPAKNAEVSVDQAGYPAEKRVGFTDTDGVFRANDLPVGKYAIAVKFTTATTVLQGRTGTEVFLNQTSTTNLTLAATANVKGSFRRRDDGTPISSARVGIGNLAYISTDTDGKFAASGVPLGTYQVIAVDPVTGRKGVGSVTLSLQDQTVNVDLVEQPQGEIRGVLYEAGGTQVVVAAEVSLDPKDNLSPRRLVTTGPDGAFYFPGVTPGEFTLQGRSPNDTRQASLTGTFPNEAATLVFNLTLPPKEPVGRISVKVSRPDGTAATNANVLVTATGGGSANTDTNGVAVFDGIRLGGVSIRANSLLLNETFSRVDTNFTLSASSPDTNVTVKLSGVGTIKGRVFKSNGTTPADFVTVKLQFLSEPFKNQNHPDVVSDANGVFTIQNVAMGNYRLTAEQAALAASTNGAIVAAGQTNLVDLQLGSSGVVIGRLVRANGTTVVPTNNVLIVFGSQTSADGSAVVQTDFEGRFGFTNVPIGTIRVEAALLPVFGLAKASGVLTNNGQILDLGDVRLDEDYPQVIAVNPDNGAPAVPITTAVDVTYQEPMLAQSVNGNTNAIFLRTGTNIISSTVQLVAHPDDGKLRVIRITPKSWLKSLTTYEVVIINGERRNVNGTVIASGPTDLVGRAQVQPLISAFTTADNDPPLLVSLFPSHNATQIDPSAVVRLTFNEPIHATNFSLRLFGAGGEVTGTASLGAEGRFLVFTPAAPLTPNKTYSISVSNIFDLAGNRFENEPLITQFSTLDTLGPVIGALRIAENKPPVAGATVMLEALLATNETGASVRYTKDFESIGSSTEGPFYRVPLTLPTNGSVTIRAIASDVFANDGPFIETNITVVPNLAPTISLIRGTPTNGAIQTGSQFVLSLSANDDIQVTNVTLVGIGAMSVLRTFTNTISTNLSFTLPSTAVAGSTMQFRAQATDSLGIKSPEAIVDLQVQDNTSPTVTFVSPQDGAVVNPAQPLLVAVAASDNSTNLQVTVSLSGAISATQSWVVTNSPNTTVTNIFSFPLTGIPADGSTITANIKFTDGVTGVWSTSRTLKLLDTTAPRLLSISPTNGAVRQSPWIGGPTYTFSENLTSPARLTNFFQFTNSVGTTNLVSTTYGSPLTQVLASVNPLPLQLGTTYGVTMLPGITDGSSNVVVDANGQSIPPEGITTVFTTATILSVTPSNATKVVAGQNVTVNIAVEEGFGAQYWEFTVNGTNKVSISNTSTNITRVVTMPTNSGVAQVNIRVTGTSWWEDGYTLPPILLDVRPRESDDDGDGWTNGYELDRGMNPFIADSDSEDFDHDGLTNGQEKLRGTDPADADTDHDLLGDAAEVALGTDPLIPDTDGDGLMDGQDNDPLHRLEGITFVVPPSVTVVEGTATNLPVTINASGAPVAFAQISPTNAPLFAWIDNLSVTNTTTNGVAGTTMKLNPLFGDAGTYTVTLRAAATNDTSAYSGETNITVTVVPNSALAYTRWKAPVSGNWNAATNWTDGLPDTNKVAVIDLDGDYTVTLNASPTIAGFVLGGGTGTQRLSAISRILTLTAGAVIRTNAQLAITSTTITGNGLLTVGGRLIVDSSTANGSGTLVVAPAGLVDFVSGEPTWTRTNYNFGTIDWHTQGRIFSTTGVPLYNRYGARFTAYTDYLWASGVVENEGLFIKKSGTNTTTFNGTTFRNNGRVVVEQGTLSLAGGGQHAGIFEVLAPATLILGNPHDLGPSSVIFGAGNFRCSSTINIKGTFDLAGSNVVTGGNLNFLSGAKVRFSPLPVTVTGGTLNLSTGSGVEMANLIVSGTVTGSDNLTVTNMLTFNGGAMSGPGSTIIPTNAVLQFLSSEPNIARVIDNYGTAQWLTTGRLFFSGGTFNNHAGATFEVLSDNSWIQGVFNNDGKLTKRIGTNTTTFSSVEFHNNNLFDVQTGTVSLSGNGTNNGQIILASGTLLTLTSGSQTMNSGSTLTGLGSFRAGGASVNFAGTYDLGGSNTFSSGITKFLPGASLNFRSGTINIAGTVYFDTGAPEVFGRLELQGGTIRGADNIVVTNTMPISSGGEISGSGSLTILAGATLDVLSGEPSFARVFENYGNTRWMANGRIFASGGTFKNRAGAVFEVKSDNSWLQGVFINDGQLIKSAGTNVTTFESGVLTNRGTIIIQSGTVYVYNTTTALEPGTQFGGAETLRFNIGKLYLTTNVNFGTLKVLFDAPPTVTGNFTLANNVGGAMTVAGNMTIPGSLNIGGTLKTASSTVVLTVNGTLTLQVTGVIDNPGTIKAGVFNNLGGTLTPGSKPVQVTGTGATLLKLVEIKPATSNNGPVKTANNGAGQDQIILSWQSVTGQSFMVEVSSDLKVWTTASAAVQEIAPGDYKATVLLQNATQYFFRTKAIPK
jgi:Bacterial Ig-like domain/Carboxypeptidase regulatory-like domain